MKMTQILPIFQQQQNKNSSHAEEILGKWKENQQQTIKG